MLGLLLAGAEDLVAAARRLDGQYLNCRLFVQQLIGVAELEKLPKAKGAVREGDVLQWGTKPARHWAVFIGNGNVLEVPEWGAAPQVTPLRAVVDEYGEPDAVRRPRES